MTAPQHPDALGAYVLGALDQREADAVARHLTGCPSCRAEVAELGQVRTELAELPPEALLDGPPDDGDLLLQRTFRQVRSERDRELLTRRIITGVAALVAAIVLGGIGLVIGRETADPPLAAPIVQPELPPGSRTAQGDQGAVRLATTVKPAAGWVRVQVTVSGIPAGQQCRVVVVGKDGTRQVAGSWLVSKAGETQGTTLDGSALVDPAQVAAVEVENFAGQKFVTVPL